MQSTLPMMTARSFLTAPMTIALLEPNAPIGTDGTVMDTPEISAAKLNHAMAHANQQMALANQDARAKMDNLDRMDMGLEKSMRNNMGNLRSLDRTRIDENMRNLEKQIGSLDGLRNLDRMDNGRAMERMGNLKDMDQMRNMENLRSFDRMDDGRSMERMGNLRSLDRNMDTLDRNFGLMGSEGSMRNANRMGFDTRMRF